MNFAVSGGHGLGEVSGGHLRFFIRSRFLFTRHIPGRTETTAKILSTNPFPELPDLLRVADTLMKQADVMIIPPSSPGAPSIKGV